MHIGCCIRTAQLNGDERHKQRAGERPSKQDTTLQAPGGAATPSHTGSPFPIVLISLEAGVLATADGAALALMN